MKETCPIKPIITVSNLYLESHHELTTRASSVSSLRLIKADMSVQDSVGVAIGFERKTFFESQDKVRSS